jgi:glucosamine-phosphate N-acetyltransferase
MCSQIRPLALDDYNRGHLTVLSVLTKAPDVGLSSWQAQFRLLSSIPNTYYPLAIISRSTDQIVALGTLFMEYKFLRGNAQAGHVEDIVVSSQAQGRGLGKKVIQALTGMSETLGAYKVILDCSEENARELRERERLEGYALRVRVSNQRSDSGMLLSLYLLLAIQRSMRSVVTSTQGWRW